MKSEHIYGLIVLTLFTTLNIVSSCEYLPIESLVSLSMRQKCHYSMEIDKKYIFLFFENFKVNKIVVFVPTKAYIKCIKYFTIH